MAQITVNGKPLVEWERQHPPKERGAMVGAAFSELSVAKEWGKDADEWERISPEGQAAMTAYEAARARLDRAQWEQKS